MKSVDKKRHLAKTITWRIIASLDTFLIAWIITGKFDWAGTIAGIEVMTKKYRYILRPIEKLKYVEKGSIEMKDIYMDDKFDMIFKPGLFLQLKNFLNGNFKELCSLREQVDNMKIYSEIAGYKI